MIPVRILVSIVQCLPSGAFRQLDKGDVVDWEKNDAQRLFKANYAEPMDVTSRANFTAGK